MTAQEFFQHWVDFVNDELRKEPDLDALWRDDKRWTRASIGEPRSEGINSPFGDQWIKEFDLEARYWKEERGFDLVLGGPRNFEWIEKQDSIPSGWKRFYPVTHEVVIEHEANAGGAWVEMTKLVRTRAKLKVLITYTWDSPEEKAAAKSRQLVCQMRDAFAHLIGQAANEWSEDPRTRYLLIFGHRNKNVVHWYGWEFAPHANPEQRPCDPGADLGAHFGGTSPISGPA